MAGDFWTEKNIFRSFLTKNPMKRQPQHGVNSLTERINMNKIKQFFKLVKEDLKDLKNDPQPLMLAILATLVIMLVLRIGMEILR